MRYFQSKEAKKIALRYQGVNPDISIAMLLPLARHLTLALTKTFSITSLQSHFPKNIRDIVSSDFSREAAESFLSQIQSNYEQAKKPALGKLLVGTYQTIAALAHRDRQYYEENFKGVFDQLTADGSKEAYLALGSQITKEYIVEFASKLSAAQKKLLGQTHHRPTHLKNSAVTIETWHDGSIRKKGQGHRHRSAGQSHLTSRFSPLSK